MGRTETLPAWPLPSPWILTSCPVIWQREAFTAADSYVSSDLETNTAATPTASMSKQGLERDHVYSSRGGGNFDE